MCSVRTMHKDIRQRLLFPTYKNSLITSSDPTMEVRQALTGFPSYMKLFSSVIVEGKSSG